MKIQLYSKTTPHHKAWLKSFAEGLDKHNQPYELQECRLEPVDADLHVFWSMHHPAIIQHCRERGQPFICLERGYVDRMNFTSVNLNGLNGRSELCLKEFEHNCSRVSKYNWWIKPRETKGRELIIIGQVPGDASLEGQDIHLWAAKAVKHFESYGYAPLFKPHPLDNQNRGYEEFQGVPVFQGDINQALDQADTFVTYSSNAGVDAWLAGVPAIAESPVSMLYKWQTIEGRCEGIKRWLCDLSFRQYNAQEMQKGEAWQILKEKIFPPSYGKLDCSTVSSGGLL